METHAHSKYDVQCLDHEPQCVHWESGALGFWCDCEKLWRKLGI